MQAKSKIFAFQKPKDAGNKPGTSKDKRRVRLPEPEVFTDRLARENIIEPVIKPARLTHDGIEVCKVFYLFF